MCAGERGGKSNVYGERFSGRKREKRRRSISQKQKEGWEWQKEPGSLSSVFPWVRSAGVKKIKVETALLKLGNVKESISYCTDRSLARTHRAAPSL